MSKTKYKTSVLSLLGLLAVAGCQHVTNLQTPAPVTPNVQTGGGTTAAPVTTGTKTDSPTKPLTKPNPAVAVAPDAVTERVNALLASSDSGFPAGTQLQNVSVEGDMVTLDFNTALNKFGSLGESNESKAQKSLLSALQSVPGVTKARVTVEGKPFESEATSWYEPMPVDHFGKATDGGASGSESASTAGGGGQ